MDAPREDEAAGFKHAMRAAYAAGSYEKVAALEADAIAHLVQRLDLRPETDVLDVGTVPAISPFPRRTQVRELSGST